MILADLILPVHTENESNRGAGGSKNPFAVAAKRKRVRGQVTLLVKAAMKRPPPLIVVTLTRFSAGELDDDGLRSALKSTRDGIASSLRIDDASPVIRFEYLQAKAPRGTHAVGMRVETRSAE